MNRIAASWLRVRGLTPMCQEPVGVTGLPLAKYGCGATPQSRPLYFCAKGSKFQVPPTNITDRPHLVRPLGRLEDDAPLVLRGIRQLPADLHDLLPGPALGDIGRRRFDASLAA